MPLVAVAGRPAASFASRVSPELAVPADDRPEFGPSGYLPSRAAARARKIVLRSPLGMQWIVASVVAGVIVVVAGVLLLRTSGEAPPPPWVEAGPVDGFGTSSYDAGLDVLFVGAGGRLRAFAGAEDVAYCEASNRLEAVDGRVWALTGRGQGEVASLDEHPTHVQDGIAYVDPTRTTPGPPPTDTPVSPACG